MLKAAIIDFFFSFSLSQSQVENVVFTIKERRKEGKKDQNLFKKKKE